MSECDVCPVCQSPPVMIINPTQAVCATEGCPVLFWNTTLPDGGASDAQVIDIDRLEWKG